MRGAVFLRTLGTTINVMSVTKPCHVLHVIGMSQRRVNRSTFTFGLLAGCDTADMGLLVVQILHELST